MSVAETDRDRKELLVTLSVAALIGDESYKRLLLVKHRKNGQWGLPAGGLKWVEAENRIETIHEALKREIREETGLIPDQISYHLIGLINLQRETKNSFGAIFEVDFKDTPEYRPGISADFPYTPTDTGEIESVEFFAPVQLIDLIKRGVVYKPDFNQGLIHWWIRNSERGAWDPYRGTSPLDEDSDLDEALLRKLDKIRSVWR